MPNDPRAAKAATIFPENEKVSWTPQYYPVPQIARIFMSNPRGSLAHVNMSFPSSRGRIDHRTELFRNSTN